MYLFSVPNLKEIHLGEAKVIVLNRCKEEEENVKKIKQFSEMHISLTT